MSELIILGSGTGKKENGKEHIGFHIMYGEEAPSVQISGR